MAFCSQPGMAFRCMSYKFHGIHIYMDRVRYGRGFQRENALGGPNPVSGAGEFGETVNVRCDIRRVG